MGRKYKYIHHWSFPQKREFRYCADVDYSATEYWTDCEKYGCDSICRCGQYGKIVIDEDISIPYIVSVIFEHTKKERVSNDFEHNDGRTDIFRYCIDRLCRMHFLFDPNYWEATVRTGYYGEEIDEIYPVDYFRLCHDITTVFSLADNDKIPWILEEEYGYLLDSLKNRQWYEETVPIDKVYVPQCERMGKLDSFYQKETMEILPFFCVCDDYKLVDGYHRYIAARSLGIDMIPILNAGE